MNYHLKGMAALCLGASCLLAVPAQAATLVVDVSGIYSNDELGDPINTVLNFNIGAFSHVTDLAWDVELYADWPSWLSEMSVMFNDYLILTPGINDTFDGFGSYAGSGHLADYGLDFYTDASGILKLEFYEEFDDWPDDWDGIWESGTITVTYTTVPEPATWAMLIAGFGLVGATARRRRMQHAHA